MGAVEEKTQRAVLGDSLGVGVAVGAYGVAFGASSVSAGLSVLQTSLLSLLAFTGGTQIAVVGVVFGGGTLGTALGSGLLLGSRNTLYGMRLAPLLRVRGPRRLLAALGTIDESTAMAIAQPGPKLGRLAFWWTFASVYAFWNLATLLGAVGAQALGDPTRFGLDAVVPAAFLALLAPRLRSGALERRVALLAALIALVLIPFTPPGVPVLASCAALLLAVGPGSAPRPMAAAPAEEPDLP
ncbi:Predicted branched-chain amino acid permease (azaleucine resistance) [Frankineae bacterium MT45]|nr:Predicted branched-chain amino acid permease (azaleucine resistance) [Frankineae bacterium MT45]